MAENETPQGAAPGLQRRKVLGGAAVLLAAGAAAGAIMMGSSIASAADTPSEGSTTTAPSYGRGQPGPGGSGPVRSDETEVTDATQLATLKAAALGAVPGGTIVRVETDAGDAAYEAHMTKADGTMVTVMFDTDLKVTAVEDGMGLGDPAPQGAPQGYGGRQGVVALPHG